MFITLLCFGESLAAKCVSLSNPPCYVKLILIDVNFNEPLSYPSVVSMNKCSGSCNTIGDPNAKVCVPNKVKNIKTHLT